jgi:hypothetical protein
MVERIMRAGNATNAHTVPTPVPTSGTAALLRIEAVEMIFGRS